MQVQPYLNFDGRCEEALEFYREALNAKVEMLMRFKDSPEQCPGMTAPPEKVMHSCFRVGDTQVMASDGYCQGKPSFAGVSLSLSFPEEKCARLAFDALSAGGQVHQPLIRTFFASSFGIVADRFGVSWMVLGSPATA
jgi:PhnB protein